MINSAEDDGLRGASFNAYEPPASQPLAILSAGVIGAEAL
jgi:hypothetical protein